MVGTCNGNRPYTPCSVAGSHTLFGPATSKPLTCNGVAPSRKPLADKLVFTLSRKRPGNA